MHREIRDFMRPRLSRSPVALFSTLALLLSACSGGGGSIPSTGQQGSTTQASAKTVSSSRFLPGATGGAADSSNIDYTVNPPFKLAYAAGTIPAALPSPSQCVAIFGLACYTPQLIRAAYNVPANLDGTGQTIVIVDAYGSPTITQDLKVFDKEFGLPDPTFNIFYPTGKPPALLPNHHNTSSWASETSLDVEWSHAIAPKATIDLVIASNNAGNVLNVAQRFAIQNHLGNVMTLSFGSPEGLIKGGGNNIQLQQADANYQAAAQAGMTVFASAGDNGASNGLASANAGFPASDPLVTSVGGTNLFMSDAGVYQNEDVWNDSNDCPFGCTAGIFGATGGAPSKIFAAPAYQQALSGNSARTVADVGYNASVYTAVLVYLSFNGSPGFYFFGGTSEGAPQWAGLTALANQAAGHSLGPINPTLYAIGANPAKYAADFHDVTVGNNSFNGPGFPAGTGYDIPTGLGTPNAANLIPDIATP